MEKTVINDSNYRIRKGKVIRTRQMTPHEKLFEIALDGDRSLDHEPGQFVMVSLFGVGEAPLSVCSSPTKRGSFELCAREAGRVTETLHRLEAGDEIGIRGPFGKGFPIRVLEGNDLLIIAGGMKKEVNNACDILTGRHVHPITAIIGGFTKLPRTSDLNTMHNLLTGLRGDTEATVELVSTFHFPVFERETEYVSLVSDGPDYPLLSGDLGSSDGIRMNKRDYRSMTNEFIVPHSSAKHTKLSRDAYAVGALSRLNMNYDQLHPLARKTAARLGIRPRCTNPYLNTVAQLVEWVHCLEESIAIIEELKKNGVDYSQEIVGGVNEQQDIKVRKGNGVGAVEVPRGTLYHNYEIDENGVIIDANCIIPTNQNLHNIEQDMEKLVPEIMDKSQAEITLALEMLVRAYDPCISCSTHILKVDFVNR